MRFNVGALKLLQLGREPLADFTCHARFYRQIRAYSVPAVYQRMRMQRAPQVPQRTKIPRSRRLALISALQFQQARENTNR